MRQSLLFTLIILFLLPSLSQAQNILSPFDAHIDTALESILMDRDDLSMPYEVVKPDAHRLSIINELFEKPLKTFTYTDELGIEIRKRLDQPQDLYRYLGEQLDYKVTDLTQPEGAGFLKKKDLKALNKYSTQVSKEINKLLSIIDLHQKHMVAIWEEIPAKEQELLEKDLFHLLTGGGTGSGESLNVLETRIKQREELEFNKTLFKVAAKPALAPGYALAGLLVKQAKELSKVLTEENFPSNPLTIETSIGLVHLGANSPSNAIIIIGSYGNDHYDLEQGDFSARVIIDPGGNDQYVSKKGGIASGIFGNDVLLDLAGHDTYRSKSLAQGAAYFGHGYLEDLKGDDHYISSQRSQGFGCFGTGLLIDSLGNDVYEGNMYVQGVGFPKGFGMVLDKMGNDAFLCTGKSVDIIRYEDRYTTLSQGVGMGYRPIASGGLGLLVDRKGNDNYVCDIYGQATSYWFAFGSLIDESGHDHYVAYQYAQGSGVHMGFSALIDKKGKDLYKSNGVSQGCGHDYAFGGLLDLEGDDNYVCEGLSQGGGNANSVSILIDAKGKDGYIAKQSNTMGYSDRRRDYGMVGLFLDLDGKDNYGSPHGINDGAWVHSTYGSGWDLSKPKQKKEKSKTEKKSDSAKIAKNLATDLETLFVQASASRIPEMYLVEPARDALLARGNEALDFLIPFIQTEIVREGHCLRFLLPRFGEMATPYLVDSLQNGNARGQSSALYYLYWLARRGKGAGKAAIPEIVKLTKHENEKLRSRAMWTLGQYKDSSLLETLVGGLNDQSLSVRRNASFGLFRLKHSDARLAMLNALKDPSQQVRNNVEVYVRDIAESIYPDLQTYLADKSNPDIGKLHILNALLKQKSEWVPSSSLWVYNPKEDWKFVAARGRLALKYGSKSDKQVWLNHLKDKSHAMLHGLYQEFKESLMD